MKQTDTSDKPVTEKRLVQILKNYPTKKEMDETISRRLSESFAAFRQEMKFEFQQADERDKARLQVFTNRILTAIDPLLKEVESRQQEREMAAAQMVHVMRRLDNHEKGLTKLEQS